MATSVEFLRADQGSAPVPAPSLAVSGGSRLVAVVAGSASKAGKPRTLPGRSADSGRNASRSSRCAGRARCSRALLPVRGPWLRQNTPTLRGPCHHRTGALPFHQRQHPGADARNHVRSNIGHWSLKLRYLASDRSICACFRLVKTGPPPHIRDRSPPSLGRAPALPRSFASSIPSYSPSSGPTGSAATTSASVPLVWQPVPMGLGLRWPQASELCTGYRSEGLCLGSRRGL